MWLLSCQVAWRLNHTSQHDNSGRSNHENHLKRKMSHWIRFILFRRRRKRRWKKIKCAFLSNKQEAKDVKKAFNMDEDRSEKPGKSEKHYVVLDFLLFSILLLHLKARFNCRYIQNCIVTCKWLQAWYKK